MSEQFTGERLVPGEVDADLWNEHISRYAFASSLCNGSTHVLDAGCGTGYGSRFLSQTAGSVLGVDASTQAIKYAIGHYANPQTRFAAGLCEALPVASASAGMIVAFEVIEHLTGWRLFLDECKRVLNPDGMLIVSTPNKSDYTEARGDAGPNPFHVHEFELAEFSEELERLFPNVRIFGQNHSGSIVFSAAGAREVHAQIASLHADTGQAGFFVAVCSQRPIDALPDFVYVPEAANVLRERGRHIQLLTDELFHTNRKFEDELLQSHAWAASLEEELRERRARVIALQEELEHAHHWAASLDREVKARDQRIVELQDEVESRTAWAMARDADLARCVDLLHAAEQTIEERTAWAQRTQAEADALSATVAAYSASRWVKLGQAIHLGPLPR